MQKRRVWIYVLMFMLAAINYIDRSALSSGRGAPGGLSSISTPFNWVIYSPPSCGSTYSAWSRWAWWSTNWAAAR